MPSDPMIDLRDMCHAAACLVTTPQARDQISSGTWSQVDLSERLHGWFCGHAKTTLEGISEEERASLRLAFARISTVIGHIIAHPDKRDVVNRYASADLGERLNAAIAQQIVADQAREGS